MAEVLGPVSGSKTVLEDPLGLLAGHVRSQHQFVGVRPCHLVVETNAVFVSLLEGNSCGGSAQNQSRVFLVRQQRPLAVEDVVNQLSALDNVASIVLTPPAALGVRGMPLRQLGARVATGIGLAGNERPIANVRVFEVFGNNGVLRCLGWRERGEPQIVDANRGVACLRSDSEVHLAAGSGKGDARPLEVGPQFFIRGRRVLRRCGTQGGRRHALYCSLSARCLHPGTGHRKIHLAGLPRINLNPCRRIVGTGR